MTTAQFDPLYSTAIRDLLITTAATRPTSWRRHRLAWTFTIALASTTALGTGAALASGTLLPGADQNTQLGAAHTYTGAGTRTIDLGSRPAGANAVSATITCRTPGTVTLNDGSSIACDSTGTGTGTGTAVERMPAGQHTYRVSAADGVKWQIQLAYVDQTQTGLLTNARGQTYGTDNATAHPDLQAVTATNGKDGYINVHEEQRLDQSDQKFDSPAQAAKWQREHPHYSVDIPVYLADGTTKIGVFHIG